MFKEFTEEVKREYQLTRADKISKAFDTFEMLEKILATFR